MQSIQALRERIAARSKEVRDLVEKNNETWKPEHQSAYDTGMSEVESLKAQAKRIEDSLAATAAAAVDEQIDDAAARRAHKTGADNRSQDLYAKFLRGGDRALSAEEWKEIRATMSTTTPSEGGYSVQTDVANRIVDSLKAYGGVRSVATVLKMASGNDLQFPTSDGTSEVGELIAQNTTATALDPSFSAVTVSVYKFSSKIVAIPFELLQDSQVDVAAFVEQRLGTRIGRATNTYFTTGTGTSQPKGVVAAAGLGKTGTTGQTTTIIFDDLIDLIHSVDPAYRASASCRFMMNDAAFKVIRKLKDTTNNRPIFIPGFDGLGQAMPDTILGYPVTTNQDMAVMGVSAKSVLFGDFSKYLIRDVMSPTLFRFEDSAYAKLGQVAFLMWHRSGGNCLDTAALKYYINSAS